MMAVPVDPAEHGGISVVSADSACKELDRLNLTGTPSPELVVRVTHSGKLSVGKLADFLDYPTMDAKPSTFCDPDASPSDPPGVDDGQLVVTNNGKTDRLIRLTGQKGRATFVAPAGKVVSIEAPASIGPVGRVEALTPMCKVLATANGSPVTGTLLVEGDDVMMSDAHGPSSPPARGTSDCAGA